ncbi:MAG: bromoperoxidase, partial [Pseudomonadota bacterium]
MTEYRREATKRVREAAAQLAFDREHPVHQANGDEQTYAQVNYAMSFTKGLDHDNTTGLVKDPSDFEAFRSAIDSGFAEPFTSRVPVPTDKDRRVWEAPTAGVVFELEGPDPQAVTMPPAPPLCSDELTFEMAEVYELALLRDTPFSAFQAGSTNADMTAALKRLNDLPYAKSEGGRVPSKLPDLVTGTPRPRKSSDAGQLTAQTVFRG